ncbi:hypothetical protein LOAG_05158 [Loa loa]|uniref:Uncharacterized protein n=1 Tax=Loa loa TaxID=7209 RepID=A0A1S0U284_LOALO|nr:hypothetical protein LOAG_05158 [Loa loa]EFO23320.1 hypothetical protein LOAG_05158 [Loa loa]
MLLDVSNQKDLRVCLFISVPVIYGCPVSVHKLEIEIPVSLLGARSSVSSCGVDALYIEGPGILSSGEYITLFHISRDLRSHAMTQGRVSARKVQQHFPAVQIHLNLSRGTAMVVQE